MRADSSRKAGSMQSRNQHGSDNANQHSRNKDRKQFTHVGNEKMSTYRQPVNNIPEIPILTLGNERYSGNFQIFKERLSTYALRHFKELGILILKKDYYVPPAVDLGSLDQYAAISDIGGLRSHAKKEEISRRSRLIQEMDSNKLALYAVILGQLSQESLNKVKEAENWEEIETSRDPRLLWLRVWETHQSGASGNKAIDFLQVRKRYNSTFQYPNETVVQYYDRFLGVLDMYDGCGEEKPSQAVQASDFIDRLDKARYGAFQTELINSCGVFAQQPYPATLAEAFKKAKDYRVSPRVINYTQSQAASTVFMASTDSERSSKSKSHSRHEMKSASDNNHNTNSSENTKQPSRPCSFCSKPHWDRDCPWIPECRQYIQRKNGTQNKSVTYVAMASNFAESKVLTMHKTNIRSNALLQPNDVLLDNQSQVHIIKDRNLLTNIQDTDGALHVTGIGGEITVVTQQGETEHFGMAFFCPHAVTNVLSYSEVADCYTVDWNQQRRCFTVYVDEHTSYEFAWYKGLYKCNFPDRTVMHSNNFSTVTENEKQYSKREVEQAKLARNVSDRLGHPSTQQLVKMINSGSILNCPITADDVIRANDIYGPAVPSLKGKTNSQRPIAVKIPELNNLHAKRSQTLHVDIMFVGECKFLISVSSPLELTMITTIDDRSSQTLQRDLLEQIHFYQVKNFKITHILSDGEGAITTMTNVLNELGITLNIAAPGQHVPKVERKIRQIKERMRSIVNSLPYKLPSSMTPWLARYAVSRINLFPSVNKTNNISPKEEFTGVKANFKVDARISFGDYVQTHEPPTGHSKSTMQPRTEGAIALLPVGNVQGSVRFLSLNTLKVITRDRWTPLPTPNDVIAKINELANKESVDQLIEDLNQVNTDLDLPDDDPEDNEETTETNSTIEQDEPTEVSNNEIEYTIVNDGHEIVNTPSAYDNAPIVTDYQDDGTKHMVVNDEIIPTYWRESEPAYGLHVTVKNALTEHGKEALKVIIEELDQMIVKKVWEPVNVRLLQPDERRRIIRSSMFLKEKHLSNGEFDKLKARIVAGGHMQDRSLYQNNSSPTACTTSILTLATIAALENRNVITLDIGGAYLNASLDSQETKVHMVIDKLLSSIMVNIYPEYKPYMTDNGTIVVQLRKALYGCVQSSKLWYNHIKNTLMTYGFSQNNYDPCIFNLTKNGAQCSIGIYVDDLFITCKDAELLTKVITYIKDTYIDVKVNEGTQHSYLGMTFNFETRGQVEVTMEGYTKELLKLCDITQKSKTPANNDLYKVDATSKLLASDKKEQFHTRVAKLLYMAKRTRPDILLTCNVLATRVNMPTEKDWDDLIRCLQYLNNDIHCGIVLQADKELTLHVYIDASFGSHHDGRSHSGMCISLGKGSIMTKSSKQKITTKSSTEAELMAVSEELPEAIWINNFLKDQGINNVAIVLHQDNQSTITLFEKGPSNNSRTKHIHIKNYFIKEKLEAGEVRIKYTPTTDMIADVLTKPVQGAQFIKLKKLLMNV